ncbi:50S ribosomal protein L25/general stress protein Ctc [Teredinibacter haidensis]|uniref:50S ribosomal protein L25/general stress protein Ctc n=1 Tax=Teredinibacter haidensis TaxID=2731755 RepID=UPI00163C4F69|nr:50S ribosomal protein L25/general stress protein Ctc [Teredinibacter haidensis]
MSNEDFTLSVVLRDESGKGASRRLRREADLVPAIIYGGSKNPVNISIPHNELLKHLENEAFYSHIISLDVAGKSEDVILKDLQRHPAKPTVLHADFLRVSKTKKFTTRVPLHFTNEENCKGVKVQGGVISHNMTDVEISCLPANLPEFVEVDLTDLEMGQVVHISDLKLPKGVESVALAHGTDHDLPVANVSKSRAVSADGDDTEAEGETEAEGGDE